MDNTEEYATLGTIHRTKTYKSNNKPQKIKKNTSTEIIHNRW
jgi:hypothetical protein